jgi:hypothetical protein
VFDDFGDAPLIRFTALGTFRAAAARGLFDDVETLLQMGMHARGL